MCRCQLKSANSLLDECQQPSQYLIESIRKRDDEISRLRQTMQSLDTDLRFDASMSTGDELPCSRPSCLCEIFLFCLQYTIRYDILFALKK